MRTTTPATRLAARFGVALTSFGLVVVLVGCAADQQGGAGDAPIAAVEAEPWTILNNVDGYPNIAMRCRAGDGIYVTRSAGDATDTLVVIPADPACTSGASTAGSSTAGTTVPR